MIETTATVIMIVSERVGLHREEHALLLRNGYSVTEAQYGMDALLKLRDSRPDLIVLDLDMAVGRWLDICRDIRSETSAPSAFSSWLTRIAINSTLMLSRKKRSHYVYSLESGVDGDDVKLPEPTETAHNPEEACILNALENECIRAIRYLSPTLRVVVQIRYRENASIAQIAKMLGISESAVKSRLLRARSKIRAHLEKTQYLPCGIDPKALDGCSTSVGFIEAGAA
jgi:RNA polymerase sigma factor (sigma-70 family)